MSEVLPIIPQPPRKDSIARQFKTSPDKPRRHDPDCHKRRHRSRSQGADPSRPAPAGNCRNSSPIPLRRRAADFEGLAQIVTGQQVSVASAAAIFARLQVLISPLTAENLATFTDEELAGAGLSRPKIRTLRALTEACGNGLDLLIWHRPRRMKPTAHYAR